MRYRRRGPSFSAPPLNATPDPQSRAGPPADEAQLRFYEAATNSTADMVALVDQAEVYRLVNDAWCRINGIARESILGRRAYEVAPQWVSPQRQQAVRLALEQGQTSVVRDTRSTGQGLVRHLESTYYPYGDERGRFVVIVTRDTTAQHLTMDALRASEAAQRAMLAAFPGYIAVIDVGGRFRYVNDRFAARLGRDASAIAGAYIPVVLGPARGRRVLESVDRALSEGMSLSVGHYPAESGLPALSLEVTHVAAPGPAGSAREVYAFGIDITERLEALEAAKAANRAKSQFLANMSHELRTPLNAVLGFGQLLAMDTLTPAQQSKVQEILRGGRHLLDLIADLLDLGRIEAGELSLDLAPVDARQAIESALQLMRPLASAAEVTLVFDWPKGLAPWARADARRLQQVLLNLLSNGIKYNRDRGRVSVRARDAGEALRIEVADTGTGLDAAQCARLFRPFERLHAQDRQIEGTGIGLALSKRLVEAMGGRIGVHSQPGEGSCFHVELPRQGPADDPASAPVRTGDDPRLADLASRRVLYIEDNPINAMLMDAMLDGVVNLQVVDEPLVGLAHAAEQRPDLVLLDLQLPVIDGFEVLRRLRDDPRTAGVPVVAVTANAMPEAVAAGLAAGFDAYLTKPVNRETLMRTLVEHLLPRGRD
jgi:PAS domain S-box-containing protein